MKIDILVFLKSFFSPVFIKGMIFVIFAMVVFGFANRKADEIIKKIKTKRKN